MAPTPSWSYKDSFLFDGLSSMSKDNLSYKSVSYLLNTNLWSKFVDSKYASACIGTPTLEMLSKSWNRIWPSYPVNFEVDSDGYSVEYNKDAMSRLLGDTLYYPHTGYAWNNCYGYWLAAPVSDTAMTNLHQYGNMQARWYGDRNLGIRPVVRLRSSVAMTKDSDGVWQLLEPGASVPKSKSIAVKFYDSSGTLIKETMIELDGERKYNFTTDICRELCSELNTMTSFTISIANKYGSTCDVGNTYENGNVNVDYNATYTASDNNFKLSEKGAYLYIKAWW